MRSRLVVIAATVLGLSLGGSAAQAVTNQMSATGDWGCVVIRPLNQGLCFEDPLPERLPIPETPPLPA